jgi:hypothetical protein
MAEVRAGRHVYLALLLALAAAIASLPTFRRVIVASPLEDVMARFGATLTKVVEDAQTTAATEAGLDARSLMDAANEPDRANVQRAAANVLTSP